MDQKTITLEHDYNSPIQEVWNAISKAEEISAWFIQADFKAQVGYQYKFTHEEDGSCTNIVGKVLTANPVYELAYTWIVEGTGVETTVKWMLSETENGTHLLLEHSGIENYPSEEMATNMFKSFSGGWKACVENLDKHLTEAKNA